MKTRPIALRCVLLANSDQRMDGQTDGQTNGRTDGAVYGHTRLKVIEIKLHFHSCSVVRTNLFLNNSNVHARCNYGLGGSRGTGSSVGGFS